MFVEGREREGGLDMCIIRVRVIFFSRRTIMYNRERGVDVISRSE